MSRAAIRALGLSVLLLGAPRVGAAQTSDSATSEEDAEAPADLVVIAHPSVTEEDMGIPELRAVLMGNKRFWPGGDRIHLVIDGQVGSPARRGWIEDVTAMTDVQYTQYWVGMVFRGRATTAPHSVPDTATAVALVAALPGAISIVSGYPNTDTVKVLGSLEEMQNR